MTLRNAIELSRGKRIKIGPACSFIFIGICDENVESFMEDADPGCLDRDVIDIFPSILDPETVIFIYESNIHGKYWFESEFRSHELDKYHHLKGESYTWGGDEVSQESLMRKVRKPTSYQRQILFGRGLNPGGYLLFSSDDYRWIFKNKETGELIEIKKMSKVIKKGD